MSHPHQHDRKTGRRPRLAAGLPVLAAAVLVAPGCGDRDPVRSYTVPKEAAPRAAVPAAPTREAAPSGGPTAAPGVMQWTLPAGWEVAENPNNMRFATLAVGAGDQRVEVAVTRLGGAAGGVVNNINRWRGQLGLPAQSEDEIESEAELIRTRDGQGIWVDLVAPDPHGGDGDGLRMFAAIFPSGADTWFLKAVGSSSVLAAHRDGFVELCESVTFGGASPAPRRTAPPAAPAAPSRGEGPLAWGALPTGWTQDAAPGAMSVASFTVSGDGQTAAVTITPLGGRQDPLANVNRWRGQVGLGPLGALADEPPAELDVAGTPAHLVDAAGPGGHIVAAMFERDGTTWFVKMSGDDPLVAGAREAFEAFVTSLRFDGGGDA